MAQAFSLTANCNPKVEGGKHNLAAGLQQPAADLTSPWGIIRLDKGTQYSRQDGDNCDHVVHDMCAQPCPDQQQAGQNMETRLADTQVWEGVCVA
jgi:hypothetical protein